MKKKDNTTTTGIENASFGEFIWPTANLRWSKDGVLEQMWQGMEGQEVWMGISTEEAGE